MKKIIISCFIFLCMSISVFAETTLNFMSDKKTYDIEETIQLNISLSTDQDWDSQISINGLDNFTVVGKSQTQSRRIINGESSTQFNLQLSLLAKKSGKYTLGPISVQTESGKIDSNTINIEVSGERIMVNNRISKSQTQNGNNNSNDDEDENIDAIDLTSQDTTNNTSTGTVTKTKKIYGVEGEEMKDIYTKKGFLNGKFFSKNSLIFLLIAVFGILFYIILQKYLQHYLEKQKTSKQEEVKEVIKPEINYTKLLENLEKNYIQSPKETFFAQTAKILRTYLDDKIQPGLSKGSLKEVERFLKKNVSEKHLYSKILDFYKKIYFPEYALGEDNKDERKSIIEQLENIIITKEFK